MNASVLLVGLVTVTSAVDRAYGEHSSSSYKPQGLQSGPDSHGSSFVSAAHYAHDKLYITGTTFGSFWQDSYEKDPEGGCFIAVADLSSNPANWEQSINLSVPGKSEGCFDIAVERDQLFVSGYMEEGGIMESVRPDISSIPVAQYGMIMHLSVDHTAQKMTLLGGRVTQDHRVSNPVSLANVESDDYLYNLSLESNDPILAFDASSGGDDEVDPAAFAEGNILSMTRWRKLDPTTATSQNETLSSDFRIALGTRAEDMINLAKVIKKGDILIVSGTTSGLGGAFGRTVGYEADQDGFITKFDANQGRLAIDPKDPIGHPTSARIASIDLKDDYVLGMCDIPADPNHVYVVGSTQGRMDEQAEKTSDRNFQAFLTKVEVKTLKQVWNVQLSAPGEYTRVSASSCVLTPDGKDVYFGGVVSNGAVLERSGTSESFGKNDIFVAKVDAELGGNPKWVRQFGSDEDDIIPKRGGLSVENNGNVIVVGNTWGSLFRKRLDGDTYADVFVMTLSRLNGDYVSPLSHPGFEPNLDHMGSVSSSGLERWASLTVVLMVLGFSVFAGSLFAAHMKTHREIRTDRNKVLENLTEFDVDDIDMYRSAAGGWHCSYVNDLADGINHRAGSNVSLETSLLGGAGLLPSRKGREVDGDSLMLDESALCTSENEPAKLSSGYGDLVDAYDQTWGSDSLRQSAPYSDEPWGKEII